MQEPPKTPSAVMSAQKPAKQKKKTVKLSLQENAPCKAQSDSSRWDALHAEKCLLAKQMLAGAGHRPVQGSTEELSCAGQEDKQASTEQPQRPALLPVGQVPAAKAPAPAAAKPEALAPAQAEAQPEVVAPAQAAYLALQKTSAAAAAGSAVCSFAGLSDPVLARASVAAGSEGPNEALGQHNVLSPQAPTVIDSTQHAAQCQQGPKQDQCMAHSSGLLEADSRAVLSRSCSLNADAQRSAAAGPAAALKQAKQQEPQLPRAHWYEAPAGYGPPGTHRFVPAAGYCISTEGQQPGVPHDHADAQCSADADPLATAWLKEVTSHSIQLPPAQWVSAPTGYGPPGTLRFVLAAGCCTACARQQQQGQEQQEACPEQQQQQVTVRWSWLEDYGPDSAACMAYLPPAGCWRRSSARKASRCGLWPRQVDAPTS